MKILQDEFDSLIRKELVPERLLTNLISNKFKELGIVLSETQKVELEASLAHSNLESIAVELTDEQELHLAKESAGVDPEISLSEEDVDTFLADFETKFEKFVVDLPSSMGPLLLKGFKDRWQDYPQYKTDMDSRFSLRIDETWGGALNLLELLIVICIDAGAMTSEAYPQRHDHQSAVREAVTRLHARGCQVAQEILLLLRNGFADGAYARWRTLHELNVVAQFIKQHGESTAQMYIEHLIVNDFKQAKIHLEHYENLGWSSPPGEEIDALRREYDHLIARHGKDFGKDYGWAAKALQGKEPHFRNIESSIDLAASRVYYLTANMNVHASSKSIVFRLGSPPGDTSVLVAGPSMFGLGEPGQATAWSLNMLTGALLLLEPNLDSLAITSANTLLVDEIYAAFSDAESEVPSSNPTRTFGNDAA